jgi:Fructose-bisphosphate aldolase class-II
MLAILHLLGTSVANPFKSRRRLEVEGFGAHVEQRVWSGSLNAPISRLARGNKGGATWLRAITWSAAQQKLWQNLRGETCMRGLRDALEQSQKDRVAIGHFNVADWVLLKAVLASGQELKVPVVVGASEGEREFVGVRQIAALVWSLREECDCPIFLNADHTHSLAKAVEAARAGFDAIVFDLSTLPFEQNVRQTKEAVEALKTINSAILVEGEIGDIGTGSEIHEMAPDLSRGTVMSRDRRSSSISAWRKETSTKFDFVINLRTARALGLTLSPDFISARRLSCRYCLKNVGLDRLKRVSR